MITDPVDIKNVLTNHLRGLAGNDPVILYLNVLDEELGFNPGSSKEHLAGATDRANLELISLGSQTAEVQRRPNTTSRLVRG